MRGTIGVNFNQTADCLPLPLKKKETKNLWPRRETWSGLWCSTTCTYKQGVKQNVLGLRGITQGTLLLILSVSSECRSGVLRESEVVLAGAMTTHPGSHQSATVLSRPLGALWPPAHVHSDFSVNFPQHDQWGRPGWPLCP